MGQDATTKVWVGSNDTGILERLPKEVLSELEENWDGLVADGVQLQTFRVHDEVEGLGVQLLDHDWNNGPKELNLGELAMKAAELQIKVAAIFKRWGIVDEPKVFLATDFS